MSNPSHYSFLNKLTLIAVQKYGNICVACLSCPPGFATDPVTKKDKCRRVFCKQILLLLVDFKMSMIIVIALSAILV